MKTCPTCEQVKEDSDYYPHGRTGKPAGSCKPCRYEGQKRWKAENPDKLKTYNRTQSLRKYNLTQLEFDSMLKKQGGGCACCGTKDSWRNLAVDHNHKTGEVRGILCDRCNRAAGLLADSPSRALNLHRYLTERGHYGS